MNFAHEAPSDYMSERQQKSLKMKSGYVAAFLDYHSYAEVPCMEKLQMFKVSKV